MLSPACNTALFSRRPSPIQIQNLQPVKDLYFRVAKIKSSFEEKITELSQTKSQLAISASALRKNMSCASSEYDRVFNGAKEINESIQVKQNEIVRIKRILAVATKISSRRLVTTDSLITTMIEKTDKKIEKNDQEISDKEDEITKAGDRKPGATTKQAQTIGRLKHDLQELKAKK